MMKVLELLKPYRCIDCVSEIENIIDSRRNIKLIFFDLDNTLISYDEKVLSIEVVLLLEKLKQQSKIVIVTNNKKKRIEQIKNLGDYEYICRAKKPFPYAFIKVLNKYKIDKKESVIVGDQLFDDILAGRLVGIDTILIKHFKKEDKMRIKRYCESVLLKKMGEIKNE